MERRNDRVLEELAQALLEADKSVDPALGPRLATLRGELLKMAAEREEAAAVSAAERDRVRHLEAERGRSVAPLETQVREAEEARERLRDEEERLARDGLAITRRREILEQELKSPALSAGEDFDTLRRRHAVEELEALERRAADLTLERDQTFRRIATADREAARARADYANRAKEWDLPIAEARARQQAAQARIARLEEQARLQFQRVAPEARAWADGWRSSRPAAEDVPTKARELLESCAELDRERQLLRSQVDVGAHIASSADREGSGGFIVWVILGGAALLILSTALVVAAATLWIGRGDARATPAREAEPAWMALDRLTHGLSSNGLVQKSEEIPYAMLGASDAVRIYPFTDEPAMVEIYAFASAAEARAAHLRMGRLLPDPSGAGLAENTERSGRFVLWGLSQLEPAKRRSLRSAFRAATR